jgi:hypothetical protein
VSDELRPDVPDSAIRLATVFRTSDPGLAGVVASILQSAAIDYSTNGGAMKGGRETEFQVRESDAENAALLLLGLRSS